MPRRRPVRVRPKAPAADESPTALEASPRSGADERRAEDVPTASEALRVLTGLAHRRTGRIPAPLLVRHALRVARGGGWPVEKAALEAILRRVELRQADALRVGARPSASPFGRYTVRRARGASRPYDVLLDGLDPIEASCDCDDFVRASLGLCKHVATVLDDLAKRPKRFEAWARSRRARDTRDRWTWNPIRPLAGPGDWLDGLRLRPGSGRASSVALPPALRGLLVETGAGTGVFAIASGHVARARRRALVEALEHAVLKAPRGAPVDVDPAVRALLVEERRRLDARHDAARDVAATRAALRTLKQRLYPYQREGVERFLETGSLLLADDMGLGKTAQAIARVTSSMRRGRVTRGLLIVPASLKPQWAARVEPLHGRAAPPRRGGPARRARRCTAR